MTLLTIGVLTVLGGNQGAQSDCFGFNGNLFSQLVVQALAPDNFACRACFPSLLVGV